MIKLIRQSAEILYVTPNAPQVIERCGRVCYKSEDGITPVSAIRFVQMLYDRGHHSVLEHAHATVKFITDRGVTHEQVRHRIASYSQESTRYCNYAPEGKVGHLTFVLPTEVTNISEGEYDSYMLPRGTLCTPAENLWYCAILDSAVKYNQLIAEGWKPEFARSVLPNSLKTEIIVTANAREWLHILDLRTDPKAHPQIRELMNSIKAKLQLELFGQILLF